MSKGRHAQPGPGSRFKQRYPDAFADDDGERVYIRNMKLFTETCRCCGRSWTHKVIDWTHVLGSGNCESAAWEDAINNSVE